MSDQNKKRSRGLGDTVKKAIEVSTFGMVKQKPGCGCKGRQAWLNKKFPYKWFRDAMNQQKENKNSSPSPDELKFRQWRETTEELLTPEQKKLRQELMQQRQARASAKVTEQRPGTSGEKSEKKCAPCEAARLERERLAALERSDQDPES